MCEKASTAERLARLVTITLVGILRERPFADENNYEDVSE